MPTPVKGCAICTRLDSAWRAARARGDQASAEKFAGAYVKHHRSRHPGAW
ncbi:hypothetical protein [Streptomyces luteireticuli]